MRCYLVAAAVALSAALALSKAVAQSAHLGALEGSAPASVTEPLVGGFGLGLAGVFTDPTSAPRETGALFSVFHSTYASVQLYHVVAAFRAGPRWSFYYAATEIKDLFDTSLTNIDPTLGDLRARAMVVGVDGAVSVGRFVLSAGMGSAHDDNVGARHTATVARVHTRVSVWRGSSVGVHWSKAAGSLGATAEGRVEVDFGVRRQLGHATAGLTIAALHGALWKDSEVQSGISAGAHLAIASTVDLRIGIGRYDTAFGVVEREWRRMASVGVALGGVRVAACYTGTRLGLGSGYGVSLGYEPHGTH